MSDPSIPWMVAAYAAAFVLLGGYAVRLVLAKRRERTGTGTSASSS